MAGTSHSPAFFVVCFFLLLITPALGLHIMVWLVLWATAALQPLLTRIRAARCRRDLQRVRVKYEAATRHHDDPRIDAARGHLDSASKLLASHDDPTALIAEAERCLDGALAATGAGYRRAMPA